MYKAGVTSPVYGALRFAFCTALGVFFRHPSERAKQCRGIGNNFTRYKGIVYFRTAMRIGHQDGLLPLASPSRTHRKKSGWSRNVAVREEPFLCGVFPCTPGVGVVIGVRSFTSTRERFAGRCESAEAAPPSPAGCPIRESSSTPGVPGCPGSDGTSGVLKLSNSASFTPFWGFSSRSDYDRHRNNL